LTLDARQWQDPPGMTEFPYRMRDLVRLTGTNAPTIHFYAQQGLLPTAQKTAGNQARYQETAVRRILWVRSLQHELRLPLRSIRWILERWGELPVDEIQTLQTLGSLLEEPDPAATAEELAATRERFPAEDIETLRRLGLVGAGGPLSSGDLRLIELCDAMRTAGFTEEAGFAIENLGLYRDAVEQLVQDELARIVEPILSRYEPTQLRDMVRSGMPLVHQLLALLHQRAVQGELQRWLELPERPADLATA
jgi:DNA-binding transcriptional MerR regulator